MASRPIIDSLVDHVTGARWQDLDTSARARARVFLLDSLGVGIAGSSGAAVAPLIATLAGWGSGEEATVWVSGERLPAGLAAIANAYQLHCLEYDCVHEGAVVHPMATVLSALLAGAERLAARGRPVPGRDFLLALCIGVDVATLLGLAATGPVRFFRPATAGGFGAAAALARLAGLDAEAVRNALGAVYAQTSGTLQPHVEGSPMLGMQVGFNARAALHAVDLAAAGIPAPHDVIDGPYGYLRLFENGAFDTGRIEALIGREWQVTRLSHKPFPSGRLTHGVVDALRRLQAAHGFRRGDIVAVEGRVPPLVMRLVGRPADVRAAIERIATEMEPGFWKISQGEHDKRMAELAAHGITVEAPSPELAAAMRAATADMADEFAARVPGAAEIIARFRAEIGG
ncbi:MAG: hypothetical protein KatS3mg118_1025 [Paracoccaceae bacterium]|nr:MAG: hypothetical protein KatS3mg118_1025 [Paracoccaceae bacterium]